MISDQVRKAVLDRFSRGTCISRSALPWHVDQIQLPGYRRWKSVPLCLCWSWGVSPAFGSLALVEGEVLLGPHSWWWWLSLGLVPRPLICGVCTHFWFSCIHREGVGTGYGNCVVGGRSVDNSFSTLPSSELSTRGFLFVSRGSVGKALEKMGSLTKMCFVRNGLKETPKSRATKSQSVPRSTPLFPMALLP